MSAERLIDHCLQQHAPLQPGQGAGEILQDQLWLQRFRRQQQPPSVRETGHCTQSRRPARRLTQRIWWYQFTHKKTFFHRAKLLCCPSVANRLLWVVSIKGKISCNLSHQVSEDTDVSSSVSLSQLVRKCSLCAEISFFSENCRLFPTIFARKNLWFYSFAFVINSKQQPEMWKIPVGSSTLWITLNCCCLSWCVFYFQHCCKSAWTLCLTSFNLAKTLSLIWLIRPKKWCRDEQIWAKFTVQFFGGEYSSSFHHDPLLLFVFSSQALLQELEFSQQYHQHICPQ